MNHYAFSIIKNILPLDEGVRVINTLCEKNYHPRLRLVSGDNFFPRVLIYPNTFIQGQYVKDYVTSVYRKTNIFVTTISTVTPPGGKMGECCLLSENEWSALHLLACLKLHVAVEPQSLFFSFDLLSQNTP